MHGSTFQTSRTERRRRRADGPALTLLQGGAGAPDQSRDAPPAHPAIEGFTPDGDRDDLVPTAVHRSGPETPSARRSSRGSASPDVGTAARSGPGPHVPQAEVVRRLAAHLAALDARRAEEQAVGGATVVALHR